MSLLFKIDLLVSVLFYVIELMLYSILLALLLKSVFSYHIIHKKISHVYIDYETPYWVYNNVYKHNKLTKSSLEKLKNNNDDKNTNNKVS